MKKITLMLLCCFFFSGVFAQEKRNCHSMNNLEYRQSLDSSLKQRMQEIEKFTQKRVKELQNLQSKVDGAIITIPVVVHVIYSNSQENISVAQIQSQLAVLNEDFRRTNSDANNKWSQAADTQIEFQLATVDPNGNATNGITRKSSTRTSWGTNDAMKSSAQGGVNPWNTSEYLNMWVCNIGGGILGYAQFPGGSAATDGVVMSPQYFGSSDKGSGFYLSAPFDKGRTTTHEVGHFLNLRHIWGDGGCSVDDFVSDTPTSDAPNYGCATGHVSCSSEDMVENYMDYSDDACMNLFTQGQKNRMRSVLDAGGARRSLALSDKFGGGTTPTCSDGIQNGDETGVDCGGSCAPCQTTCDQNEVTFSLTFDNYASETSWSIVNESGTTIASGSGYGSGNNGTTLVEDLCLPDGCYTFNINDSYGDGICCAYGSGSYSITNSSGVLASGGSFGSSESKEFCVGSTTAPTCTDGIQNGDETGIDCGGSCAPCDTGGDAVLFEGSFETGWEGWTDGGSDCARYSGSRSSDGNYSIRLRDNSGVSSSMTSEAYNLNAFNQVVVTFEFYAYSMENNEDFWLRYYNGSSWSTVASWARGVDFNNNTFYAVTVTLDASNINFVNNARFRFQCDASANADQIYIDKVKIAGSASGARVSPNSITELRKLDTTREGGGLDDEFSIYPNPVEGSVLHVKMYESSIGNYKIINMIGQTVKSGTLSKQININDLKSGVYLFEIDAKGEEKTTQKFIKQ